MLALATTTLLLAGCNGKQEKSMTSGIDLTDMDTTVAPGSDFYRYACGGWIKKNPMKDEYSRYGSFDALREVCLEQIKDLVTEIAAQKHESGSLGQKIGDLYNMAMDSVKLNADGIAPLKAELELLAAVQTRDEIRAMLGSLHRRGQAGLFGFYIGADAKDSKNNIVTLGQGGLTLGQKEYYLENDDNSVNIRKEYKNHLITMFQKVGFSDTEANVKANDVLEIETRIAKEFKSAAECRNPLENYNKLTYAELKNLAPGIDWDAYFAAFGITDLKELVVGQPKAIQAVSDVLNKVPVEKLKSLLEWKTITSAAGYLSDDMAEEKFRFFGTVMSGRKEMRARWKRAVDFVDGSLGDAVGEMYVAKHFPAEAKERMINLVKNLQIALGERIQGLEWMGDSTKAAALDKLNAFRVKIGYPDKWTDYSKLDIKSDSYLANDRRITEWAYDDMVARSYNKPVDLDEWFMSPQTVNAYYNPTTNEICFPAGILQPPFFDMHADDAFNYGGIGVVIGHEMTHGFDDSGRRFDKEGNLRDWWTAEDAARFESRAQVMNDFFSNIELLPGLKANGTLTLGENLADHGGLMVAYQALHNATKDAPLTEKDGLTPEQRFFIAYANLWAGHVREAEIHRLTKTDPHSLGEWRVNGALPHIDAWYNAFGITEQDSLFVPKAERVTIW